MVVCSRASWVLMSLLLLVVEGVLLLHRKRLLFKVVHANA
jgi:hypothetical protein